MKNEINTLQENKTWILVPRPSNKQVLTNRWVYKTTKNENGEITKYKARLVARGHVQKFGIDYEEVFAPVARYEIVRALLAASVNEEMFVHQMDVVAAYVQGNLSDEVYMEQPVFFVSAGNEEKVCKLLRPLYGLKQAGCEWYKKLDEFITSVGGKRTIADPCVYVFGKGDDRVIVIVYVDDLIISSKKIEKLQNVKIKLSSQFKITDLGPIKEILGINVERDGPTGKIRISQKKYIDKLIQNFNMNLAKSVSTLIESNMKMSKEMCPTSESEICDMKQRPYRELVGSLIHLANATRPDIAFAASTLSKFCSNPGKSHWEIAKRVLRYLKQTSDYGISYVKDK